MSTPAELNWKSFKGASFEGILDYIDATTENDYNISNFEATLYLYKINEDEPHTTRTLTEPTSSRRTTFFTVAEIEALPADNKLLIVWTKRDETSRVYAIHAGSFTVSDVQRTGTVQATGEFSIGDSVQTVVPISFGTTPLKGDVGDTGPQGPVGPKGDVGDTGPQGPVGDTGSITDLSGYAVTDQIAYDDSLLVQKSNGDIERIDDFVLIDFLQQYKDTDMAPASVAWAGTSDPNLVLS